MLDTGPQGSKTHILKSKYLKSVWICFVLLTKSIRVAFVFILREKQIKTPPVCSIMAEICQNWYICSFRANVVGYPIILQPRDHHHWLQHEKRVQKHFFHHLISQNGTFLDHTNVNKLISYKPDFRFNSNFAGAVQLISFTCIPN